MILFRLWTSEFTFKDLFWKVGTRGPSYQPAPDKFWPRPQTLSPSLSLTWWEERD